MSYPNFWSTPFRYIRWASHEKPAILYSILIGSMGPVAVAVVPPIRKRLGDYDAPLVPLTYPSKQELSTLKKYYNAQKLIEGFHSPTWSEEDT